MASLFFTARSSSCIDDDPRCAQSTHKLAFASAFSSTIDSILISDSAMIVYVYPTGGLVNPPACGGSNAYFSFSMTRPLAKEYLASLLAAQARGAPVAFWGKGTCVDQAVSETLDYFRVES
jgi:hypothetical protein